MSDRRTSGRVGSWLGWAIVVLLAAGLGYAVFLRGETGQYFSQHPAMGWVVVALALAGGLLRLPASRVSAATRRRSLTLLRGTTFALSLTLLGLFAYHGEWAGVALASGLLVIVTAEWWGWRGGH